MADPCQNFDCGPNGECLSVNMTPTCVCDRGFVAFGSFAADGTRSTRCEQPMIAVPDTFYAQRLPNLPRELPGGRVMDDVDPMLPVVEPTMDDLGSTGMPVPRDTARESRADDGGCAVRQPGTGGGEQAVFALLGLLGLAWLGRRVRRP
jgi:MYXO-CTERM domain-containing protein